MTPAERLRYYLKHTYSVESILRSSAGAAILQGTNTPSEWGQGGVGYARRFANSYGQHIIRATLMYGSAGLLHEDNRYFRSHEKGFLRRLNYAVVSTVMARRDDGTRKISISALSSYGAAAFISRAWQPASTRGAMDGVSSFSIAIASDAGFNIAREFFPRIFHSAK